MNLPGDPSGHPLLDGLLEAAAGLQQAASEGAGLAWQLSRPDTGDAVRMLAAVKAMTAAVEAAVLVHADTISVGEELGTPSTARWLAAKTGCAQGEATTAVATATALGRQPAVVDRLADARIALPQAKIAAAALDRLDAMPGLDRSTHAEAVGFLCEQAGELTPRELTIAAERLVETLTTTPDTDDPDEEAAVEREAAGPVADRWFRRRRDPDGTWSGAFRGLDAVAGAALDAYLLAAGRIGSDRHDGDSGAGSGAIGSPADEALRDRRTRGQRELDAFAHLAQQALATAELPGDTGRRRPVLVVTADYDVLRRRLTSGTLDTGQPIPEHTLRRMACDADLLPAVLGGDSAPLDLGRTRRLFTTAQRHALALRDRGCTFPGCDRAPRECEAHHNVHWEDGGLTDVSNGALVCDSDHDRAHREGWVAHLAPDGHIAWVPPPTIDPRQRPRRNHRYRLAMLARSRT